MVHTLLTKTGLKTSRITTHSLRHTAANIAIQNGIELPALKAFMRHSSYAITELYIQQIQQKYISDCQVSNVLTKLIENEGNKIESAVSQP
jgi:integrase